MSLIRRIIDEEKKFGGVRFGKILLDLGIRPRGMWIGLKIWD